MVGVYLNQQVFILISRCSGFRLLLGLRVFDRLRVREDARDARLRMRKMRRICSFCAHVKSIVSNI